MYNKRKEITKTISYKLKLTDSIRFMASSGTRLSIISLKEFMKLNINTEIIINNVKHVELNTKSVVLNTQTLKMI